MTDFVYPVNDRDDEKWGDDDDVLSAFGRVRPGDQADWRLGNSHTLVKPNDRIWVHASKPVARLVGVGVAADLPYQLIQDGQKIEWRIEIRWDVPLTQILLTHRSPEGLFPQIQSPQRVRADEAERLKDWLASLDAPEPQGLPAGRLRRLQEVIARQGQANFRQRLMLAYGGKCAITGCAVEAALQAAHITPYAGIPSNRVANGLLLRADLHNLFDKGLIWIDGKFRVRRSSRLAANYLELEKAKLRLPTTVADRPDKNALRRHREEIAIP